MWLSRTRWRRVRRQLACDAIVRVWFEREGWHSYTGRVLGADSTLLFVAGHVRDVQGARAWFDSARSKMSGKDSMAITMPWSLVRGVSMWGRASLLAARDSTQSASGDEATGPPGTHVRAGAVIGGVIGGVIGALIGSGLSTDQRIAPCGGGASARLRRPTIAGRVCLGADRRCARAVVGRRRSAVSTGENAKPLALSPRVRVH